MCVFIVHGRLHMALVSGDHLISLAIIALENTFQDCHGSVGIIAT